MPKPSAAQSLKPSVVAAGALAVLVLLAYANAFRGGFVFDNRAVILEDARLRAPSPSNLSLILNRPYWWPIAATPLYRPVTTLSYLMNYSVFGNADHPLGYHVANLVLHIANVWLLFALALRIGRRFWPALLVAGLWAVHPLGTEAVTNIVGRADLLAACGVLTALLAHLRLRESEGTVRWAWMAASFAAMTIGVFSKESAASGVAIIVLLDLLWPSKTASPADVAKGWLAAALPVVVFLTQRAAVLSAAPVITVPLVDNPIAGAGFWSGRLTAVAVMGRYIELVAWPLHLSADYSYAQVPLAGGSPGDWLAWAIIAALVTGAGAALVNNRLLFFCLAGSFVSFLPAANLLFVTGTVMAERLMYLPSAFLVAAAVATVYAAADRTTARLFAPVLLCGLVVICAVGTFTRNAIWRDDLSLWQATVSAAPRSFKSHDSLAEALYESDSTHANLDRVIKEKESSLSILNTLPESAVPPRPIRAAASYYLERGDWLQAHNGAAAEIASVYRRAAELGERYLGLVSAHPISPQDTSQAQLLVSTAYAHLEEGGKALAAARAGAIDQPFNPMTYRALAAALLNARQADGAAVELMTGFMVTGNADLRAALLDLYRSGLDTGGCATTMNGSGMVLNVSCEIVRRHLCAAAVRASDLQRRAGHPELASQVSVFTSDAHCERVGTP